jgi:hypothetical protein
MFRLVAVALPRIELEFHRYLLTHQHRRRDYLRRLRERLASRQMRQAIGLYSPILRRHDVAVLDFPIARPASLVTLTVSATPAVKFGCPCQTLDDVVDPFDSAQGKTFH